MSGAAIRRVAAAGFPEYLLKVLSLESGGSYAYDVSEFAGPETVGAVVVATRLPVPLDDLTLRLARGRGLARKLLMAEAGELPDLKAFAGLYTDLDRALRESDGDEVLGVLRVMKEKKLGS